MSRDVAGDPALDPGQARTCQTQAHHLMVGKAEFIRVAGDMIVAVVEAFHRYNRMVRIARDALP